MTDTPSPLRLARDRAGISRERVAAQLDPPISSKTLERWEKKAGKTISLGRLEQLAAIYDVPVGDLAGDALVGAAS